MKASSQSTNPTRPDRNEVLKGVVSVVAEQMGMDCERIGEGDSLSDDLACDSLDIVEISMELEEHFDISVPDGFGDTVQTIGSVTDGIMQLLAGRHA